MEHRLPPLHNTTALFWWLLVLTVAEVAVAQAPWSKLSIGILLVAMALAKAALVMIYFMHLKFERRTVWLIAVAPALLGVALVLGLVPDGLQQAANQEPESLPDVRSR